MTHGKQRTGWLLFFRCERSSATMSVETRSWQELCEDVSKETDSKQLMGLVAKLLKALDECKASVPNSQSQVARSFSERARVRITPVPLSAKEGLAPV